MAFTEMVLKETYDSDEDHIVDDFYIPALAHSVKYDRLAGFFSSTALAISARGMAQFLQNGGKMRLVTSIQISAEDQKAIKSGLETPDDAIARMMNTDLDLADQLKMDHVGALAWMLAKGTLEIKVAVPLSNDGSFYTKKLEYTSLYHQKVGILHDHDGNIISFSGSINETGKGWNENVEEFKVFCSWKSGQDKYGSKDARRFEKFWHGNSNRAQVFDLPIAIRERLIQCAPETEDEAVANLNGKKPRLTLRGYQTDAAKKWKECGKKGIFEMATGTGKTRVAISCIKHVIDELDNRPKLVVVTCPYIHLIRQWAGELKKFGVKPKELHGNVSLWKPEIANLMLKLRGGVINNLVLVTTHDTLSSKKFIEMAQRCNVESLIVGDEVHALGAERRSEGLLDNYTYRLGLSATPERYFDDKGTEKILRYFGGVVFKFGLDSAIQQGYLSHYKLFPHAVYLTNEEMDNYNDYSRRIAIEYAKDKKDHELIKKLTVQRSHVIRDAHNKIDKFDNVLDQIDSLNHCLVYCSSNQIDSVSKILHKRGIKYHRFTHRESQKTRASLISGFARGDVDVLVAMKCLDEGVDVPSTKTAIILASSGNPAEFVQRRGRILRKDTKKDCASIHDLLAFPPPSPTDNAPTERWKRVVGNEMARLGEFATSSDNPEHSRKFMNEMTDLYAVEVQS